MADSKLSAHLDKVAYGVAILIGIVLLVLPFVLGGDISAASDAAKEATRDLKEKIDLQQIPSVSRPGTVNLLTEQWMPGSPNPRDPQWIHQIAPVLIRNINTGTTELAMHEPPVLTELVCQRDKSARKPTILVKGNLSSENKDVIVKGVELWRQGGDGVFEKIHSEELDTDVFEHIDADVVAGQSYTYRLVSIATKDPEAAAHIAEPSDERKRSADLGPTPPTPYDVSARIYSIIGEPGKNLAVMAKVEYWDYEAEELKGDKRPKIRQERERFENGRFEFFPIDPLNRRCRLRDHETRAQHRFKQGDKEKPVALFDPVVPDEEEADEDADEDSDEDSDEEAEVGEEPPENEEATPAPAAPKPSGGRRRGF